MDILNLREITKQIKIKNSEKNKFERNSKNILSKIKESKNCILLSQTNIENISNEINQLNNEIKHLSINFKISIFEKFIELISFGIINYKQKNLENINHIKDEINELQNTISPEDNDIKKEKEKIKKLELEQKIIMQQIKQIQVNIIELENQFNEKLKLFKNKLLSFQEKIVLLSKERYINDYTKIELSNELNNIIYNHTSLHK